MCDYEIKWYVLYVSSDLISLLHDCVLVGPFFFSLSENLLLKLLKAYKASSLSIKLINSSSSLCSVFLLAPFFFTIRKFITQAFESLQSKFSVN